MIPFREESEEASWRRRSDDGMKVVTNNWRVDGEREAMDGCSGITMAYHLCANPDTQKGVRVMVCSGDTEILPAWAELSKEMERALILKSFKLATNLELTDF